jgi:fatty-acyl-CoA synthase
MNIFSCLDRAATRFPDRPGVLLGTKAVVTFTEVRSGALRLAAGLRSRWSAGSRIAVVSENRPELVELLLGPGPAGSPPCPSTRRAKRLRAA